MPLQNRVDPWGALHAVAARGEWMGNRGILHDAQQQVVAAWRHRAWVTCRTDYPGRKRVVFSPGNYSELFFLDEATALSAGHRPCASCRYRDYQAFKGFWGAAQAAQDGRTQAPSAAEMDRRLHAERAASGGSKALWRARADTLPDGTFVQLEGAAWLLWQGRLHRWTHAGYDDTRALMEGQDLTVLTPPATVRVLRAGYRPQVHPSAVSRPGAVQVPSERGQPDACEMQQLLDYLPRLCAPGFAPVRSWEGAAQLPDGSLSLGWPDYDPLVREFFHLLASEPWADTAYQPARARSLLDDPAGLARAELAQVREALTLCMRSERFGAGGWADAISSGAIRRLLQRLAQIHDEAKPGGA